MKKRILTLATLVLFILPLANAQYYYNQFKDGENPKGLNTEMENPFPASANVGWTTLWSGNASSATAYSPVQNIPFDFEFNGAPVTKYVAGNFGSVTFTENTPAKKPSSFGNLTLPNSDIPDNSVCVLGLTPKSAVSGSITYTSAVMKKTYGESPNRQHWIWFNFFGEANIQQGWTYWAIVLEETTNNIYIVDMKTLCVNAQSQLCNSNVKMSAGIQIDESTSYNIVGSPNIGANQILQNLFTPDDNSYYRFTQGVHPENSARAKDVVFEQFNILGEAPFTVKSTIQNHGTNPLTSIEASYRINGGSWTTQIINTPSIARDAYSQISHPITWTPSEIGNYTIDFQIKSPNAGTDPVEDDDMASITIQVIDTFVARRSLIESFSSSTCGPCRPGNIQLNAVTNQMEKNQYTYLKYQYNFPGTGDPYYTLEARDRGTYYGGVNSVPTTFIDGGPGFNPNATTLAQVQGYQSVPAFVAIEANGFITWKDKINFNININPFIDLPAGIRLHVAIVERTTYKNIRTNGETEFHNVLKKFAYGAAGQALPAIAKRTTHNVEGSYQVNGNYRLPANGQTASIINWNTEHSIENFHNLGLVVFLQNVQTREILQSHLVDIGMNLSANQTELHKALIIYPNPANDFISISFEKANQSDVIIRNIQGAIVSQTSFNFNGGTETFNLDTRNLATGVYTVTVNSDGATITKKIVISH